MGRKYAIYLPKAIVNMVGIGEGGILLLEVRNSSIVLMPVRKQKIREKGYWAEISPEEVEHVGERLSREFVG